MLKRIILSIMILICSSVYISEVRGGDPAVYTRVHTWPNFYPGLSMFEAVMIVKPGGITGLNQILYINGAGTHVRSTIEFLGDYDTVNGAKITAWDWARQASSKVTGSDGNTYTCKKDHKSTVNGTTDKPITGTNWSTYWELRGSGGNAWGTNTVYLDREGDDRLSRHLYEIRTTGLDPITENGYTPPSGNFLKTNYVIPGYSGSFNAVKYRNIARFLNTEFHDGRTMEKWSNAVGLWDWTTNSWVEVYSYTYWSDIDWNKSGDVIIYQPWVEANPESSLNMTDRPKLGFDDCKIIINNDPPYKLTPTEPRITGTFTSFTNAYPSDWTLDFGTTTANYTWIVHFSK